VQLAEMHNENLLGFLDHLRSSLQERKIACITLSTAKAGVVKYPLQEQGRQVAASVTSSLQDKQITNKQV
jgi:hypothetical protein